MIKQILLCIVLASLCISDYDDAWPAMKCDPPQFKIVSQIGVNTLEIEAFDNPGSDAMCAHFWWCIRNLFDQIGAGGRVVIVNWTEDNQGPAWIPSMWKEIDFCRAQCMNSPWYEYGEFDDFDACIQDCREEVYDDREIND